MDKHPDESEQDSQHCDHRQQLYDRLHPLLAYYTSNKHRHHVLEHIHIVATSQQAIGTYGLILPTDPAYLPYPVPATARVATVDDSAVTVDHPRYRA
jgi:hypothetical protein